MQIKEYLWGRELSSPSPVYFIFCVRESLSKLYRRQVCPPTPKQLERKLGFHNMIKHCQINIIIIRQFVLSFMQRELH